MKYQDWLQTQILQSLPLAYLEHGHPNQALLISIYKQLYRDLGYYKVPFIPSFVDQTKAQLYWQEAYEQVQVLGSCPDSLSVFESYYANNIGYELQHIRSSKIKNWWYQQIEQKTFVDQNLLTNFTVAFNTAIAFEMFLQRKYLGQKRFSLSGLEVIVPSLLYLIKKFQDLDYSYLGLGMSHRGRLNVMANVLGVPWVKIQELFEHHAQDKNAGSIIDFSCTDVKYHLGCSATLKSLQLELFPNVSHVESINSIVVGAVRALRDVKRQKAAAILLHGDGAFMGQGVVSEYFNLSALPAYQVGGIIHIIANNHIGFTTSSKDGRATLYASDLARAFEVPIIHVSANDFLGVIQALDLSFAFRQNFATDVLLDINGVRIYGHNESDDASITQPLMVQQLKRQDLSNEEYQKIQQLELSVTNNIAFGLTKLKKPLSLVPDLAELRVLWQALVQRLSVMNLHRLVADTYHNRTQMLEHGPVLWSMAEILAFLVILSAKGGIRFSGQDILRGTFSQRHLLIVDQQTGEEINFLQYQDFSCFVHNSPLSEYAVLAYEFGYSLKQEQGLVIWEAQYGDFANGASIVIDQYLAGAYTRWGLESNLVLLLPHGYEGQGAEHSSARIERYLQLAANDNLRIIIPSNPVQYYYALLDAVNLACPTIIFTPKALLRHAACVSSLESFFGCTWKNLLVHGDFAEAKKIILLYGSLYYNLLADERFNNTILLIRLEQLYPFPAVALQDYLHQSTCTVKIIYAQVEPFNQGALPFIKEQLSVLAMQDVSFIARPAAAVTAVGSLEEHLLEQKKLLDQIFAI